jgi:hypothetical protein
VIFWKKFLRISGIGKTIILPKEKRDQLLNFRQALNRKKMKLTGGIVVYTVSNNQETYYYGENSWWLIDDWIDRIRQGVYFEYLEKLKINPWSFSNESKQRYLPQLIIDFDNHLLINNFYDQALESRVPADWQGVWVEDQAAFLQHIPLSARFWETLT